ncbi:MAG TPA: SDR family oxidoreductase [Verrucomicrobiae bacterium]|nr:SDR family oxidoreductase [Verrucomicrobiae bacterium]
MKPTTVFITGASGALGSFITRTFLKTGARVIGASLHISATDFPEPNFEAVSVDFRSVEMVSRTIADTAARFGGLDVVVHVLGGFAGGQSVAETTNTTWEQMRDMNLTSAFYLLREAIPHLRRSPYGRFIAIGSLMATDPHANLGAYVVFKAALATLVRTVALENRDSPLTANVVLPGTMDTAANRKSMPEADFSTWLDPQDVADLVLWLADERAAHVNGAAIPIEGHHG